MINSDVFDQKFINNWEDQVVVGWKETHKHFGEEYDKIGRAHAQEQRSEPEGSTPAQRR